MNNKILGYGMRRSRKKKTKKKQKKNERAGYELTAFAFDGKAALESVVLEFTRLKLARLF